MRRYAERVDGRLDLVDDQPLLVEEVVLVENAGTEENHRRREGARFVQSANITEHGDATDASAVPVFVSGRCSPCEDRFCVAYIRRQKRMARRDATVEDADSWRIGIWTRRGRKVSRRHASSL